ncbi:15-hydroxyprostaglandin dehydrogenase [Penicillium odoratum]|uniref:15-hydroxyprostaglandin dehydrogenase n=1 Tax=Penicillium odoratum TaxID=1167516 RepID=UPI0025480A75|nr:15-hydroxyprostaglandin dehydrogenase [Penicillium odoratum]KAJ5746173.1 15-hydroxyprostaglandin dehydrogenase [Penicillium odoratum]
MAHLHFEPSLLESLAEKVVVLTGAATGIGRSAVQQFCKSGAKVVFGDVVEEPSRELESELGPNVQFIKCDASSYPDQLNLFKTAYEKYSRIDIVVANAGIGIHQDQFTPEADIEKEPSMAEIDVNLKGTLFTVRIGQHYLRKSGGGDIVMVSSIAGFKEGEGLVPYTASKHGVVGVMRGIHLTATRENIRVNVVCPWMTKTRMVLAIEEGWYERGLPTNEAADVARSILLCATANRGSNGITHSGAVLPFAGKIVFVAGGESYEIEDRIQSLEPQWLGEENSRVLFKGQEYLAAHSWDATKTTGSHP